MNHLHGNVCPPEFLALAHNLADAASPIICQYFRTELGVDFKSDASPVTISSSALRLPLPSMSTLINSAVV